MESYVLSFAASIEHKPEHPDRTARQTLGWDVRFQVWPNRPSMVRTIRMQERRERRQSDWRACVPLGLSEGY